MKPFLFLGTRAEDDAADNEYAAVLRCAGLDERDVRRFRLERDPLGAIDLEDWSGIVLGGGPFNSSDPEDVKVLGHVPHLTEYLSTAIGRGVLADRRASSAGGSR